LALDVLFARGVEPAAAFRKLKSVPLLDASVVDTLVAVLASEGTAYVDQELLVAELRRGMSLLEDVRTRAGALLVAAGQEVTAQLIIRLRNAQALLGKDARIRCRVPKSAPLSRGA
jgi:hypothetical protein